MAFTAAQKTLAYECLGLFQGSTFDWYEYQTWPGGTITAVPFTSQISFATATARLEAIFTAIEAGSDGRESRIGSVLTEYSNISLDQVEIASGGIEAVGGLRYSSDGHRKRLKITLEGLLGIHVMSAAVDTFMGGGSGARSVSNPR